MIESRQYVPDHYEKSRDFQVFLKIVDLVVNAAKADIDYFTSLLSPDQCKARMLPLLSNYVGKNYWYDESVKFNRTVIKNWADLKQHRGCEIGISMAVSLAIHQLDDLSNAEIFKLFNVNLVNAEDKWGRKFNKIQVYLYYNSYLSKLYELLEAVRPAGTVLEIIPSVSISSQETISLTDEYRMLGYDYCTGKLLKIGDIPIIVENSWQIIKDGQPTGEYLVDGEFYNSAGTKLNLMLDSNQNIIDTTTGNPTGRFIKAPNIYKYNEDGTSTYTGEHFNLNHAARVINSCYEMRNGGNFNGYFITADGWRITDAAKSRVTFYLKDYMLGNKNVKKVYRISDDTKYNWHIDLDSGYFVKDDEGEDINISYDTVPWDSNTYISKKRYIMNETPGGIMYTTPYFVNIYEDIEDSAGNVILSKKDRYKVSDSTSIGFSEVHNTENCTTYDKTWINARPKSYTWDKDYYSRINKTDYNDYNSTNTFTDSRIIIKPEDFLVDIIVREYDGTNNIGVINAESESVIEGNDATIPVDKVIPEIRTNSPHIRLNVNLRKGDSILSVFKELRFTFDSEFVNDSKTVFVDWKLADDAELHYNVYQLPERLSFADNGIITKKKIYFTNEPIIISDKTYDGRKTVDPDYTIANINIDKEV